MGAGVGARLGVRRRAKCVCKKYASRKARSIAFQNAGFLRKYGRHYNVSAWDTHAAQVLRRHDG